MALDDEQKRAVEHFRGAAMILAGPGSGKTTVITNRIMNLINAFNVSPEKILVITFTRMAACEMKERFLKLSAGNLSMHSLYGESIDGEYCESQGVTFGTFHSIFFMMLRQFCNYRSDNIVRNGVQKKFLKEEFIYNQVSAHDENGLIDDILSEFAKVKSMCASRHQYKPVSCEEELFWKLYSDYSDFLKREHLVDFEDMMVQTRALLSERGSVLDFWQQRFEYILVDEFQDVSPVQLDVVKMLSEKHRNIFVVGDDDQSIYGFRGAAPGVMQDFIRYFPDAEVFRLDVNYRCGKSIVDGALQLINNNRDRFFKKLRAYNQGGMPIEYYAFDSMASQESFIAKSLSTVYGNETCAVLTRTNSEAEELLRFLARRGVDASYHGRVKKLYEHWIASDIMAYISIAAGSTERTDFIRILNKPARYISRLFFTSKTVDISQMIIDMKQKGYAIPAKALEELRTHIKLLSGLSPFAAVNYIRKAVGYDLYISEYAKEKETDKTIFFRVLDKLQSDAGHYGSIDEWRAALDESEEHVKSGVSEDLNSISQASRNINICTMHRAKGLEFDTVIITSVNEGVIPYGRAETEEQLEEERRLFYVAVTRAKTRLIICSVAQRYNKKMQPSRFLAELRGKNNLFQNKC